jgi:hypothetical protein
MGWLPVSAGAGYAYNPNSPNTWSWLARTLPYLEQGPLYNQAGIAGGATISAAEPYAQTNIKSLLCPADEVNGPRTDEANIGSTFNYGGPAMPVGQTNYKGVCGSNWAWGTYTNNPGGPWGANGLDAGNGIFYRTDGVPGTGGHGPLRITSITDGTSNTFMIGEDIPKLNVHCDWPFFNHATGTCAIPPNSAMAPGQPGWGDPANWPEVYSFRSKHTNGLQFAMGDGSVRFINQGIDLTTYRNLSTYNGGEVVSNSP